jgi:MFS transporter, DHA1 family, multidrug resistance protein
VFAPLVGAHILRLSGWHGVFVALAALSGSVLLACIGALPESLPAHRRRPGGPPATDSLHVRLLMYRQLVGYVLTNAFGNSDFPLP